MGKKNTILTTKAKTAALAGGGEKGTTRRKILFDKESKSLEVAVTAGSGDNARGGSGAGEEEVVGGGLRRCEQDVVEVGQGISTAESQRSCLFKDRKKEAHVKARRTKSNRRILELNKRLLCQLRRWQESAILMKSSSWYVTTGFAEPL